MLVEFVVTYKDEGKMAAALRYLQDQDIASITVYVHPANMVIVKSLYGDDLYEMLQVVHGL